MKNKILFSIALFCSISSLFAQITDKETIVNTAFGGKTELYFSFPLQNPSTMEQLSAMVSIDNVSNGEVIAVATKEQFAQFLELEIPYTILPSPFDLLPPETWKMTDNLTTKSTNAWDAYPTYQAYLDMMAQFAINYPALCRIDTVGYTVQGRLLLTAVISDNVNTDENEPEFFYSSTMHGDETTGYVLLLRLIDYLLSNYGTNPEVTSLVNNIEIYINPNANPDGTYYGGNNTVTGARRNNYNNKDLNRNFPVPDGSIGDDGTYVLQPETQAFINYGHARNFVISSNIHGGIELANYPWDYTYTDHADKIWWNMVSTEYATSAQNNSPSGYFDDYSTGFDSPGVTEGASWYIVKGSRQDYMQYFTHCRELTLEISSTKNPAASTLPNYWNYNYQALILYMKQVLYGFKGIVTDGCTGLPIEATIELVGHDAVNSHVYSSLPVGNYHRPVKSGTYTIKASAPGYVDQQYSNVSITDYNTVIRNFQLLPEPTEVEFISDVQFTCDGHVSFQNNTIASSGAVYTWHFGDGSTSNEVSPEHTYTSSGVYSVKLVAASCAGNDSLIRNAYIQVALNSAPVSDFIANTLTPNSSTQVQFNDLSTCNPTSWSWSFSPSTVTFVNGTNNTSQHPQVTFQQNGYYSVTLTATNANGSDQEIKTSYINVINCTYCTTSYSDTNDEWISNFSFNTIQNPSTSTTYSNFTNLSTDVIRDSTYSVSVGITVNGTYTERCVVFIDWNQNCTFGTGESYSLGSINGSGTLTSNITVPATALTGPTRMRVSMRYNTVPTGCDVTTYGEAEDYTLMILATPPCNAPTNLQANNITDSSAVLFWQQTGNVSAWEIELVPAGLTPSGIPNITSGTNPFTIAGLNPNSDYDYYVRSFCNPNFSNWSGPMQLSTECINYEFNETAFICEGDSFLWQGIYLTIEDAYSINHYSAFACDSIYTLNLDVLPKFNTVEYDTVFDYELPYQWQGNIYWVTGTYQEVYQSTSGCDSTFQLNLTVQGTNTKTLYLQVFIEGLYISSGMMKEAENTQGPEFGHGIADVITVELHNANSPYDLLFVQNDVPLHTDGTALIFNLFGTLDDQYYIVVKHRNSFETWSNQPMSFLGNGPFSYDFTSNASQAYGNNLKPVSGGFYAIWSGDLNQDGLIDIDDMSALENASQPPVLTGYLHQDINGDSAVDIDDMTILENNTLFPPKYVMKP